MDRKHEKIRIAQAKVKAAFSNLEQCPIYAGQETRFQAYAVMQRQLADVLDEEGAIALNADPLPAALIIKAQKAFDLLADRLQMAGAGSDKVAERRSRLWNRIGQSADLARKTDVANASENALFEQAVLKRAEDGQRVYGKPKGMSDREYEALNTIISFLQEYCGAERGKVTVRLP